MWTRKELKDAAKSILKVNYWPSVIVALILNVCVGGSSASVNNSIDQEDTNSMVAALQDFDASTIFAIVGIVVAAVLVAGIVSIVVKVFVLNPLSVGCRRFFVDAGADKWTTQVSSAFKTGYMNSVKILFFQDLFIALWSLLLVVPGIVKMYEYRMIPYLIAENPEISKDEAFAKSKEMMTGNKWNAFVLDLSFIGWGILSVFTCGILSVFYVSPYIFHTDAELYRTLKG